MKNSALYYITPLLAAAMLSLSSCEALKGIPGTSASKSQTTSKPAKSEKKTTPSRNVLPQDREQFNLDKSAKTYTSDDLQRGIVAGDWAIEAVGDQKVEPSQTPPYIKFEPKQGRFYACNGCNYLSGSYTYNTAHKSISFGDDIAATMRLCDDAQFEAEISQALVDTRFYTWNLADSQLYLYLYNADNKLLLTLMHQDFAFLTGTWTVKALNDEPITAGEDIRFVIDVAEHKIHGNTGCNLLNGKIYTDMDAPNSISFQQLTLTDSQCADTSYENELIVAFEDASQAKPISENKVLLIDNHGIVVLELERIPDN